MQLRVLDEYVAELFPVKKEIAVRLGSRNLVPYLTRDWRASSRAWYANTRTEATTAIVATNSMLNSILDLPTLAAPTHGLAEMRRA